MYYKYTFLYLSVFFSALKYTSFTPGTDCLTKLKFEIHFYAASLHMLSNFSSPSGWRYGAETVRCCCV